MDKRRYYKRQGEFKGLLYYEIKRDREQERMDEESGAYLFPDEDEIELEHWQYLANTQ